MEQGDPKAGDELLPQVYQELRRLRNDVLLQQEQAGGLPAER